MKRNITILFLILILSSCDTDKGWDCAKTLGDSVIENRETGSFNRVFVQDRIDINYRFSEDYRVEVTFGENIIGKVKTEVVDGTLNIENTATCDWVRNLSKTPVVTIYAPTMRELENRCSGNITFVDSLQSPDFTYQQWETNGVVKLLLKTESARIYAHNGFVDLKVQGATQFAELYNAGNGKFDGSQLISQDTRINSSTFQELRCYSDGYLFVQINARGDVLYAGNPTQIDEDIKGTGVLTAL